MISIKIQPDKLDLLLTEEAKYLKKVRAIREKIYNLKVYRDKIKSIATTKSSIKTKRKSKQYKE